MRYDDKFARALEQRYAERTVRLLDGGKLKTLEVVFWFSHFRIEQLYNFKYRSVIREDQPLYIESNLMVYTPGEYYSSWQEARPNEMEKLYNFDWNHKKISLAKRLMFIEVQQTKKEISNYEKQIEQFYIRHGSGI